MDDKAVYIVWTVIDYQLHDWRYVSVGVFEPVYKPITTEKVACYSHDVPDETQRAAQEYIRTEMQDKPDAHVEVR